LFVCLVGWLAGHLHQLSKGGEKKTKQQQQQYQNKLGFA